MPFEVARGLSPYYEDRKRDSLKSLKKTNSSLNKSETERGPITSEDAVNETDILKLKVASSSHTSRDQVEESKEEIPDNLKNTEQ